MATSHRDRGNGCKLLTAFLQISEHNLCSKNCRNAVAGGPHRQQFGQRKSLTRFVKLMTIKAVQRFVRWTAFLNVLF